MFAFVLALQWTTPSVSACTPAPGAERLGQKALPAAIRQDLKSRVSDLSPAGGPFNATDVGSGPFTRFLTALHVRGRYVVAYEHGGRGYHLDILTYEINDGVAKLRNHQGAARDGLCAPLLAAETSPLPPQPFEDRLR